MADDEKTKAIPWQTLPFYRSLAEQVLLFGVPKPVIVLNAVLGYIFIFNFHFFYIIPICLILHVGAIALAKNDTQFFDCLKMYTSKKNYYST